MLGAALIALALTMLSTSAMAWAACLRLGSLAAFLLSAYLVAWVEVVLACLALSVGDELSRPGLLLSLAIWLGAAWIVWRWQGRPCPPTAATRLRWLVASLRTSELGLLASVLVVGYAYLVLLAVFTPQNDSDPLVYHLARAALWRQNGHIGVFDAAIEPRLDVNPVVAEIGDTTSLILAGSERFVWIVQLSAVAALAVGAFALARRVGMDGRSALLGAMIVPALPLIAMQAITGYNDLVVAAFIVSAAVFVLGRQPGELVSLILAVALAVGTKFTAPFLLPIVALVAFLGQPARRWSVLFAAGVVGAGLGSGWYVVNLVRTGRLDGGWALLADQEPVRTLPTILASVQRLVLDSIELPGTAGSGTAVFVCLGFGLGLAGLASVVRRAVGNTVLVGGLLLAATPFAVPAMGSAVRFAFAALSDAHGDIDSAREIRAWRPSNVADGGVSWYGPLAAALGATIVAVCVVRVRRYGIGRASIALSLAPWLGIVIIATAITYDPWRGRLMAAAWVMNVAMWGTIERRSLAVAVTFVTSLTFALSVAQYVGKPMGIDALSRSGSRPIWSLERWEAQTVIARGKGEQLLVREVERRVPSGDTIAVSVSTDDLLFPYFGSDLRRRVLLVDRRGRVPANAAWMAVGPHSAPTACSEAWRTVVSHRTGWRLYERIGVDRCKGRRLLSTHDEPVAAGGAAG
jgi:hypothetical protein